MKRKKTIKEEITKDKNYLIIKVPLRKKRTNPYMEGQDVGEMDNIVALITEDEFGNTEMGFCKYIDMAFKGKDDQWTDFWYKWWGDQEEFEEICKKLGIDIIYD